MESVENMSAILNLISPLNKEINDVPSLRAAAGGPEGVGSENKDVKHGEDAEEWIMSRYL